MGFLRWLKDLMSPPAAIAPEAPVTVTSTIPHESVATANPTPDSKIASLEQKLMRYKDPLEYRHGTLDDLTASQDDVVCVDRLTEPYPVAGATMSFYDAASDRFGLESSMLLPATRAATFMLARSNVVLAGYRTLIGHDGTYNLDESFVTKDIEDLETARLGHPEIYRNEHIGFRDTETPAVFNFERRDRKIIEFDHPVICLSSNEAPNYGSFLFRIFPKLVRTARLSNSLPILVPNYFATLRPFMELAGIASDRVIDQYVDHLYLLRRAIIPSMPNRHVWLDRETSAFYDALVAEHGAARSTRRVYVTRRSWAPGGASGSRVMTNEAELIAELETRGFDIVEPEKLSAVEQIRVFSSASVIIMTGGSAIYNTVFCRPGTKLIDIEGEPHWLGGHAKLFNSRGLDFGIFEGTPSSREFAVHHQPFSLDLPRFKQRLDDFL